MDNTNNINTIAIIGRTMIRPRLLLQALAFTAILYFCVEQTPRSQTEQITQLSNMRSPSATFSALLLPPNFENNLLQHASQQLGVPISALRIAHAQSQTWSDNCLGLPEADISCTKTPVPGWQVEVKSDRQTWTYRTNATGSVIKIDLNSRTSGSKSPLA